MNQIITKIECTVICGILAMSMCLPINALTAQKANANEPAQASKSATGTEEGTNATLTESGNIADWTECGSCEWMIDANGKLTVRPANGNSEGNLSSIQPWDDYLTEIKTIVIEKKITTSSCYWMFASCTNVTTIDLSGLDTSQTTTMHGMFYGCTSLTSVNTEVLNTTNVTDMDNMFGECKSLKTVDVSKFNTSQTMYMLNMFNNCSSLTSLDLSSFDTSKIVAEHPYYYQHEPGMYNFLGGCIELSKITLGEKFTFNGTSTSRQCNFPVGTWQNSTGESFLYNAIPNNTKGVYTLNKNANIIDWTTCGSCEWMISKNGDMTIRPASSASEGTLADWSPAETYYDATTPWKEATKQIKSLKVESTVYAPTLQNFLDDCSNLKTIDISGLNTANTTNMGKMFKGCSEAEAIDVSKFNTAKVTDMNCMFYDCSKVSVLDVSGFDTSQVTYLDGMFGNCMNVEKLNVSNFNTVNCKDMFCMFTSCEKVAEIDVSNFNTSKVEDMYEMFKGCSALKTLDLTNFDNSLTTTAANGAGSIHEMFDGCQALRKIALGEKFTFTNRSNYRMCSFPDGNWVNKAGKVFAANAIPDNVLDTYIKEGFSELDFDKFSVDTNDAIYTSNAITPAVSTNDYTLNKDYTITYENNIEIGQATITIAGTGSYIGSKTYTFNITKAQSTPTNRLAGQHQTQTAASIAKEAFPNGSSWVIIARDDDFADAMSATGLAGVLDAPIMLTDRNELSSVTAQTVKELGATNAYIIGGTGAISGNLEGELKDQANCTVKERVWGQDAWDTSVECYKRIKEHGGNKTGEAIVAMSTNFQDALSISSFAYKYALPIFLETDANNGRCLTDAAKTAVREATNNTGKIYVPGGTGAVPAAGVEDEFGAGNVVRLEGHDGFDTSNQIATWMVKNNKLSASTVCIANGAEAPKGTDALAGAALAGKRSGVILLANSVEGFGEVSRTTIDGTDSKNTPGFLKSNASKIANSYILGGTAVMPEVFTTEIKDILN